MKVLFLIPALLFVTESLFCQGYEAQVLPDSLETLPPATIDFSTRKKVILATGISGYAAVGTSLYFSWYRQYEQQSFHFFNDFSEWNQMDKAGHVYAAYLQSDLIYSICSWGGYNSDKALAISSLASLGGQVGIEIMDGFSANWGFSWSDIGANVLGTSLFYFQQKHWQDQKIRVKMSYWPVSYSDTPVFAASGNTTTRKKRASELYGQSGVEKFLKDYNGQTIWLSVGLSHLLQHQKIPEWLAVSVGYSASDMYGGRANAWMREGEQYSTPEQRARELVLALDYDLGKIKTKNRTLSSVLKFLNIFKWPAPGISYDTEGKWGFHLIYKN